MNRRWFVAKYIEDVRRREPQNVGVVLMGRDGVLAQFLGERAGGTLDGRSLRFANAPNVYRAWIAYWRRAFREASNDELVRRILSKGAGGSYVIESAGEEIAGGSDVSDQDLLDELFTILVKPARRSEPESQELDADDIIEELLVELKVADSMRRGCPLDLDGEEVFVDYWLDGEQPRLLSKLDFAGSVSAAWKSAQATAYAFNRARTRRPGARCAALLAPASDAARGQQLLPMFRTEQARVIDLGDRIRARDELERIFFCEEAAE